MREVGAHQTVGIDLFVTSERVMLLDTQVSSRYRQNPGGEKIPGDKILVSDESVKKIMGLCSTSIYIYKALLYNLSFYPGCIGLSW